MSVTLVIIFNHKYDLNIPLLKEIYGNRFEKVYFIVPFYEGKDEDVISVYESSYFFQGYVAQAYRELKKIKSDHILFIGDDLIIDPAIDQNNIYEKVLKGKKDFYISNMEGLSDNHIWTIDRFINARDAFLEDGVAYKKEIPTFEDAYQKAVDFGIKDFIVKDRNRRFPLYPWKGNIKTNIRIIERSLRESFNIEYPLVYGYSDIFIVPRNKLETISKYFGVFSAMKLFVEIAIPTAIMLTADPDKVVMDKDLDYKNALAWSNFEMITSFSERCDYNIVKMPDNWPDGYLYMHPIKLSGWK